MKRNDKNLIYLDHNATTPVAPEAVKAMMPYMENEFGNPSSGDALGERASRGVGEARKDVASLLGCRAEEIIFTSGGTESNNMVLKGVIDFTSPKKFHVITCAVEHLAVLNPAIYLMEMGVDVTVLPVDGVGQVDPDDVEKAISKKTALISIMLANNETGTLQPVNEISRIAKKNNIPIHTDAAQAVGKIGVDVNDMGVDFLTVAGHKVYAPKGIGALFIRNNQSLTPLIHGAAQEFGKRAGTENVILAAGLGAACKVAKARLKQDARNINGLRDLLEHILFEGIDDLVLNGHPEERLPNTLNVSVPGIEGARILDGIPHIMASTGAACHDRTVALSHVLSAMGVTPEVGMGALRFTLGRTNNKEQIIKAAKLIVGQVKRIKNAKSE
jgi:cysteine desulfurase